jgi:hypothetical protein
MALAAIAFGAAQKFGRHIRKFRQGAGKSL